MRRLGAANAALLDEIKKNNDKYGERDRVLYHLDRGMLYLYAGNCDQAIEYLTIAEKEMSSEASVLMRSWPMSSSGKKPFGMTTKSQAVAAKVASATTSTSRWSSGRRARSIQRRPSGNERPAAA